MRSTIGPVLHIDAHTVNGAKGRFARICVQINIDKPLINSIKIGKMVQSVQYEGLHLLCFSCGCIGHRKDSCPFIVKGPEPMVDNHGNSSTETNSSPKEASMNETSQVVEKADSVEVYGDWMVVKHKTRPHGKGMNSRNGYSRERAEIKGDGDDRRGIRYIPRDLKSDHRKDVKRKAAEKVTLGDNVAEPIQSQLNHSDVRYHRSEMSYKNSGTRKSNSRKELPNHGKNYSVGWESRKWPSKVISDNPLVKNNAFSCLGGFTFRAKAQENECNSREMGNFSKGEGDTNWRQNNRRDSKGPNGHNRLVQGGGLGSLKEHLPFERGECSTGLPSHGRRGMDQNPKSVLAFSHGQAKISSSC